MSDIDLKSRYDIGWFSAYDTLKGMVKLYGFSKVLEALMEIGNLTKDAADLATTAAQDEDWLNKKMCATCGHSESRHNTAGGFCKHCPCIEFVDHTTSAKPLI